MRDWKKDRSLNKGRDWKWGVCLHCGSECWVSKSKDRRLSQTCSLECARRVRSPEKFVKCKTCQSEFYSHGAEYCSVSCHKKSQHWTRQPWAQDYIDSVIVLADGGVSFKVIMRILGGQLRQVKEAYTLAGRDYDAEVERRKLLRSPKKGKCKKDDDLTRSMACEYLLIKRGSIKESGLTSTNNERERAYKKHAKKIYQKIKSERYRQYRLEHYKGISSKRYKSESEYVKKLVDTLEAYGFKCQTEVSCSKVNGKRGRKRRCDILAVLNGVSYAIEAKGQTKARHMDECFGQALFSAKALNAIPVVAFPPDCGIDEATKHVYASYGCEIIHRDIPFLPNTHPLLTKIRV